jgi:MinD-like ATPase involved in chromosome partitioning or flagellar assembly
VVENMSGFTCPHCGNNIDLFKVGGGEKAAREMKVPFLGRIPIDAGMVISSDNGAPFVSKNPDSGVTEAFLQISEKWIGLLEEKGAKGAGVG